MLLGAKTGFGAGKIVVLGGHVEPIESAAQAVVRDVAEESSIRGRSVAAAWCRDVPLPRATEMGLGGVGFGADQFSGQAVESDEIAPEWFPFNELPVDEDVGRRSSVAAPGVGR